MTTVFAQIDTANAGSFPVDVALSAFAADKHPRVATSRRSPEDVRRDFESTFPLYCARGVVTLPAMERFYEDVSFGIANDDDFQLILWNVWGLGGGKRTAYVALSLSIAGAAIMSCCPSPLILLPCFRASSSRRAMPC